MTTTTLFRHPTTCDCVKCMSPAARAARVQALGDWFEGADASGADTRPIEIDAAPRRYGNGPTGAGRRQGMVLATDKQVAFLRKLIAERPAADTTKLTADLDGGTLTKRAASTAIETLLATPKGTPETPAAAPVAPAAANTRPNRYAGKCVRCGGNVPAEQGNLVKDAQGRWAAEHIGDCPAKAETPTPTAETPIGIHRIADGTIFKVYETQAGRLAAKRLDIHNADDAEHAHGSFEYETGAIRRHGLTAATLLDQAEAARFGAIYKFCCACGTRLETEESLNAGYGPKCAERYGWPWGTRQRVAAK